jgi:Fe2+ or Zn2+ uptake regulation protein
MAATDQILIAKLRERRLRVTSQRLVIHRALAAEPQHVTAEQVLTRVRDALPGTSLPTVYATLELLAQLGLVHRVATGGAVLFDSRITPHSHTACRSCGRVTDLDSRPVTRDALRTARSAGFRPDDAQLVVWGLCPDCAADQTAATESPSRTRPGSTTSP